MAVKKAEARQEAAAQSTEEILIPAPDLRIMEVRIRGVSPYICHRFSEKAIKQMSDAEGGLARRARGAKDPEQEWRDSLYLIEPGRYGIPASSFKKAAVKSCDHVSGIKSWIAKGAFFVLGDLVPITGGEPECFSVPVRLKRAGSAEIRHRGRFNKWEVKLRIRYNAGVVTPAQVINLLNTAGFAVGVGEWRPEKGGSFGMFEVVGGAHEA